MWLENTRDVLEYTLAGRMNNRTDTADKLHLKDIYIKHTSITHHSTSSEIKHCGASAGTGIAGMAAARPITNMVWQCHTNKLITCYKQNFFSSSSSELLQAGLLCHSHGMEQ